MKNIFKSRTFWISIIEIVVGLLVAIQGYLLGGGVITVMAIIQLILRTITTKPITLGNGKGK